MKGSVMPVSGTSAATTAMFIQAWNTIHTVTPVASNAPVMSGAESAMRVPLNAMTRKSSTTLSVPSRPSSSPRTAKIESVYGAGRNPNFSFPAPRPSPSGPPRASP